MADIAQLFIDALGTDQVLSGDRIGDDYDRDEALTASPVHPEAVLLPRDTSDVVVAVGVAAEHGIPLTARGAGTGLSGGCRATAGGAVVSFERMDAVLEVDARELRRRRPTGCPARPARRGAGPPRPRLPGLPR